MGVIRPESNLRAGKPCQCILQTPASRAISLLYNGLPTYVNYYLNILIKNIILINLFILFHPSTRYIPDTNLRLLPKPTGNLFYRLSC